MIDMATESKEVSALETEVKKARRAMIVEDETQVGDFIKEFLQGNNVGIEGDCYYVNGQDAIDALAQRENNQPPIDLLVTDMGLKDGDYKGKEVIGKFRMKYPDSKIIILTGNIGKVEQAYTHEQLIENNIAVMEKPFKLKNFRQTLVQLNVLPPQQNKSNQ